ncbi:hypothetical protein MRB53_040981 [Persea americana]|nr:hypothetical protein MRB53_040981 [Persea americana]
MDLCSIIPSVSGETLLCPWNGTWVAQSLHKLVRILYTAMYYIQRSRRRQDKLRDSSTLLRSGRSIFSSFVRPIKKPYRHVEDTVRQQRRLAQSKLASFWHMSADPKLLQYIRHTKMYSRLRSSHRPFVRMGKGCRALVHELEKARKPRSYSSNSTLGLSILPFAEPVSP